MRIGAKLRNYGASATMRSVLDEARRAEQAGFDSVWLSDHIVMPVAPQSHYPYSAGGEITWDPAEPWLEPVAVMAALAATTSTVTIGVAVLVVALREPVTLAKQLACIEQLAPGRVVLGIGDGWLGEELALFGVDFADRRRRTADTLAKMELAWSGVFTVDHLAGERQFIVEPRPSRPIPVLIGGSSPTVFDRVAQQGYGWLPLPATISATEMVHRGLRSIAERTGRAAGLQAVPTIVVNAARAEDIAPDLRELAGLGVSEVLVDGEFDRPDGPEHAIALLRAALCESDSDNGNEISSGRASDGRG